VDSKQKRAETVTQLQRQIESLMKLCGAQLEKIHRLELENARLKRRKEREGEAAKEGGGGVESLPPPKARPPAQ